jgi:hypothetical protein
MPYGIIQNIFIMGETNVDILVAITDTKVFKNI